MAESVGTNFDRSPAMDAPPGGHGAAARALASGDQSSTEQKSEGREAAALLKPVPRESIAREYSSSIEAVAELWARVADVDPITYYWEEPAESRETAGEDASEESSPLFPGRRPLYKRSEPPPSAEEELTNVIAFLQKLHTTVRRAAVQSAAPSPTEPGLTVLQAKRLSRSGVAPDHFQIGVLPKTWSPPAPSETAPDPDPQAPAEERKTPAAPASPEPVPPAAPVLAPRRSAGWPVLLGVLFLAALGAAGYLWTRAGNPLPAGTASGDPAQSGKPAPAGLAQPAEEGLNTVNLALEAMQRGDFKKASALTEEAQKHGAGLRGLSYQAALLAFNQGRAQEAEDFLDRSIAANEAVADCWYLRANTSFASAGPARAAENFEQAVYAAPFNPRYYFFRAECLRRNGNTVAALAQFQQALRCRPSSADTELILFKIGMTKLESNADLIFKTELHDRLSHEPVPGDTLLLAAADAISRGEYAEAASNLRRAALALPPRTFQSRVRDYVFRAQAKQPDITAVLRPAPSDNAPSAVSGEPPPRTVRVLVDPATRSLAEADPAGW